jgi:hypothetical protein
MQAAEVQTEQDIQTLSSLERSNKLVLEENNYLRKRLEAHAADVERAENRLAQQETLREELNNRYNEVMERFRQA